MTANRKIDTRCRQAWAIRSRRLGVAAVALAMCGIAGANATAQVVMKFGHDSGLDSPYEPGAEWFKQQVESKTNGRVTVQIFPNAQLGDEATMINGLKIGSMDVMYSSTGPISQSVKEVDLFSLPFLFKDVDNALRVANGPVGDSLKPKIEAALQARVAGWSSFGERDMWNGKRPIRTIADLKGLKMRIQQSAVQKDTYAALGAEPVPMSHTELYTALQTGVVDGGDEGPADVELDKIYQVTKYMTLSRHFILLCPMLISDKFLSKLSPEDQKTILDLGRQSVQIVTDAAKKDNLDGVEKLKSQGLQVFDLSDADRKAFVDAVQSVYRDNADRVGGQALIQQAIDTP